MLTWLVVGAGGWGSHYTRAVRAMRGVRPVGFADTNPKVLARLRADGVPSRLLFDDALAALKATKPDIVSCSVPNPQRVPILVAAIGTGAAVVVDKPLAHTPGDARKIVAAAGKSRAPVCVAQDYRFKPGAQKVKALLEAGRLGRVAGVAIAFLRHAHSAGDFFYGRLEGPAAIGLEMCIHHWDLLRWLCGRDPQTVEARSWRPSWGWGRGHTALQALAGFSDGLRATYCADWGSGATHTSWNGRWVFDGEQADLVWDDVEDGPADVRLVRAGRRGPVERRFSPKPKRPSIATLIALFHDAVRAGAPVPVPLEDNVHSIGLALAAVESCRRGREVDVGRFMEREGLSCRALAGR